MRILHISTRLIIGGSQENTVLSCIGAADQGHTVALAYGPIYGPEGSLLPRVIADPRIERFEVPNLLRHIAPLRDRRCLKELRELIRKWKPDVVHTHSSKAGILGRKAAWSEKVPVVVHTIHGLAFHPFQSWWKNFLYIRAERWAARRCHAIVSVADAMTIQALAQGVGRPEQFVTIRSAMETEHFIAPATKREELRARFGWDESVVVLGTIARLTELKGHDDMIDAFGEILTQTGATANAPKVALLWVGDGWWRDRLVARLKALGIADRVAMTGLVDPSEIPEWISAMDVVVHPSYREGLPRAVVQGMLEQKPVIAYDVDGAREVCQHERTGILVKAGDRTALRAAAQWMIDHPNERRVMGERGREVVRVDFDWRTMNSHLLELYRRLGAVR
jgi:glycosyltransferase involved in cell wall biosynthesis